MRSRGGQDASIESDLDKALNRRHELEIPQRKSPIATVGGDEMAADISPQSLLGSGLLRLDDDTLGGTR